MQGCVCLKVVAIQSVTTFQNALMDCNSNPSKRSEKSLFVSQGLGKRQIYWIVETKLIMS